MLFRSSPSIAIEGGDNFSNTLVSLDLEASPVCYRLTSVKSTNFGNIAPYVNCPTVVEATHAAWQAWIGTSQGVSGMSGGDVAAGMKWTD